MKNIDVNVRFVILGILGTVNIFFKSILLGIISLYPITILGFWALSGLLGSFPNFTSINQMEAGQNIIIVYFKKILTIFTKFILAMLSFSLPFVIYLYLKP